MGIEGLLLTLVPALLPAFMDGIKGLLGKLLGINWGDPKNFDDFLRKQNADTERLKALALLDQPAGDLSKWVANLRGSIRYIAVSAILGAALIYNFLPVSYQSTASLDFLNQLSSSALFFLLGDRVYLGLKGKK